MDAYQEAARRFVREILRVTGWSPSGLATRAGLSHTTITRFLNDEVGHTLSTRTIGKIRSAAAKDISEEAINHLWLLSHRQPPDKNGSAPASVAISHNH